MCGQLWRCSHSMSGEGWGSARRGAQLLGQYGITSLVKAAALASFLPKDWWTNDNPYRTVFAKLNAPNQKISHLRQNTRWEILGRDVWLRAIQKSLIDECFASAERRRIKRKQKRPRLRRGLFVAIYSSFYALFSPASPPSSFRRFAAFDRLPEFFLDFFMSGRFDLRYSRLSRPTPVFLAKAVAVAGFITTR